MEDLGEPIAYLVLKEGTPVYDRNGDQIGVVEHVLADEPVDIFHGLIVHTMRPRRHVFAEADQIAELRERGVQLAAGRDELHELPAKLPSRDANAGSVESPLQATLRRAWDRLSQPL